MTTSSTSTTATAIYTEPERSRAIASALREGIRSRDTLGRYGGDEFVLLLPDTAPSLMVTG